MRQKLQILMSHVRTRLKPFLAVVLVGVLMFGFADGALAARAGGRIGGGSFRAPSRTYSSPRTYRSPSTRTYPSGGYYPGGGFGFPFLVPIFGIGGGFGGLFTLLLFITVAGFLVQALKGVGGDREDTISEIENPTVSVAKIQVGLLAEAKHLQDDLNRMALTAKTDSAAGLTQVLQEASLSLLRHPEYWQYANVSTQSTRLLTAEQTFNQLVLAERSKLKGETLTNVNNRLHQAEPVKSLSGEGGILTETEPGAYIVATVVVATQGKLDLPKVASTQDVRQALSKLGAVSSDRLLAVEILWTPQAAGETLTADEVVAEYPDLVLI
jgi:uncharacterized membrane protein